uniref:Uncharacterized protein n=1 Tax=Rhizophora mucronata TaxID=61149 RepID=A0A2P2R4D5_RHIMU
MRLCKERCECIGYLLLNLLSCLKNSNTLLLNVANHRSTLKCDVQVNVIVNTWTY